MPRLLVDAAIAHFDSVFVGPNGDYPSVLESLLGISAEAPPTKRTTAVRSIT